LSQRVVLADPGAGAIAGTGRALPFPSALTKIRGASRRTVSDPWFTGHVSRERPATGAEERNACGDPSSSTRRSAEGAGRTGGAGRLRGFSGLEAGEDVKASVS
jgi:hypothetical protein